MFIDFILSTLKERGHNTAIVWAGTSYVGGVISARIEHWLNVLAEGEIQSGAVVGLEGDFSPEGIALFLALIERGCIVIPHTNVSHEGRDCKDRIAQVEYYFRIDNRDCVSQECTGKKADHPLYNIVRERQHPGLVLFSSGTSGEPKAAVHDFSFLLEKFQTKRQALSTINFLLFDHWGGLNTMLHILSNGGTLVAVRDRSPHAVCELIQKFRVELLPTTPTFINLLLASGCHKEFDLSSLKVISYGAEPMPESTLARLHKAFPLIKLQQTYGLIEVGVLRSKSREDGSLWMKVGGEGFETRIVDSMLQIRTKSTILGYLNAPTPITPDGWFMTGDAVEQDGDFMRILGRKSEIINVGGEKVYPVEVESVIQGMSEVSEVTVFGEKNPLLGNIVCAKVRLTEPVKSEEFVAKLKRFCRERLEKFKVPVKVRIVDDKQYGDRFKKMRAKISESIDLSETFESGKNSGNL